MVAPYFVFLKLTTNRNSYRIAAADLSRGSADPPLSPLPGMIGRTMWNGRALSWKTAIGIGFVQCLAMIPGTSRSGITMTAARFLGLERHDGARFSMLLAIPVIIGAGSLKGWQLYQSGDARLTYDALLSAGLAFAAALIAIAALMAWLKRWSFTPFVLYRIFLGGFLLTAVYGWVG